MPISRPVSLPWKPVPMSLKRRLDVLELALPDLAKLCCLDRERGLAYGRAVHERFDAGPMPEGPPEFLPDCLKGPTPCPEGERYGCAVWKNVSRLEHLRDFPDDPE